LVDESLVWVTGRIVQCEACGRRWTAMGRGVRPVTLAGVADGPACTPGGAVHDDPIVDGESDPVREGATPDDPVESPTESGLPAFRPLEVETPWADPKPEAAPDPTVEAPHVAPALFRTPRAAQAAPSRYGPPGLGRWLAILFLVALALVIAVLFRDVIVRAVPALAGAYAAVGLGEGGTGPVGPRA
jgi:hypothetical protein